MAMMARMRPRFVLTLVALCMAASGFAGQEIDVEGAIDLALRQNRSLKLAVLTLEGREVALDSARTAFAISIHKSQGSEYPHVHVVLPPDPEHRILSRQLLYTALSRARHSIHLYASDAVLEASLQRRISRVGGLQARLAG